MRDTIKELTTSQGVAFIVPIQLFLQYQTLQDERLLLV